MIADKGSIMTIFTGYKQFAIPVYQRIYSWGLAQCERLWTDILYMHNEHKQGHFVGSIVNVAEQVTPMGCQKFVIIDGQQRMTTLTLLLLAIRNYIQKHPDETGITPEIITSNCLINEHCAEKYKLLLTQTDAEIMKQLIEGLPVAKDINSKLLTNYYFFVNRIEEKVVSISNLYTSIQKLQIVNITLDRNVDDPQLIFESLNSTGIDLSQADLIRNHVLMGLTSEMQIFIYENIWHKMELLFIYDARDEAMDRFFRDYLTMYLGRIPREKEVYQEFKAFSRQGRFASSQEECSDLYKFASYYTDFIYAKNDDKEIAEIYHDIAELQMEVAYPFIMRLTNDYKNNIISRAEYMDILRMTESYIFRRAICNIPTNSLNKTFATLKNDIKENDYFNSIKAFFRLRESYKVFPNDSIFSENFLLRDCYNSRNRIRYILRKFETYDNKNPIVMDNYTIEHIMPQNENLCADWKKSLGESWQEIQKKYIHTIGNLTLTAYNPEMSDKPFIEKMEMKGGFKESSLRLNNFVIKQDTWNETKILERARQLINKAIKIWQYPEMTEREIEQYDDKKQTATVKYSLDDYQSATEASLILYEELDRRILNLSNSVRREYKKFYIAYKVDTNFVAIQIQSNRIKLVFTEITTDNLIDSKHMCKDIRGVGNFASGNVEFVIDNMDQMDDAMALIDQAYDMQAN